MCVGVVILNALFFSQGGMINIADYTQTLFRSVGRASVDRDISHLSHSGRKASPRLRSSSLPPGLPCPWRNKQSLFTNRFDDRSRPRVTVVLLGSLACNLPSPSPPPPLDLAFLFLPEGAPPSGVGHFPLHLFLQHLLHLTLPLLHCLHLLVSLSRMVGIASEAAILPHLVEFPQLA
jgi:hypothetical protein